MSDEIHCPRCGSSNVECIDGEVHNHICHDCGYSMVPWHDPRAQR